MITFKITATEHTLKATADVDTEEQASEIAAQFPKSTKVVGSSLSTTIDFVRERDPEMAERLKDIADPKWGNLLVGYVYIDVRLVPDAINKGKNESGIKRFRSFLRNAEKFGYAVEYVRPFSNSLTEEEYEALIS